MANGGVSSSRSPTTSSLTKARSLTPPVALSPLCQAPHRELGERTEPHRIDRLCSSDRHPRNFFSSPCAPASSSGVTIVLTNAPSVLSSLRARSNPSTQAGPFVGIGLGVHCGWLDPSVHPTTKVLRVTPGRCVAYTVVGRLASF